MIKKLLFLIIGVFCSIVINAQTIVRSLDNDTQVSVAATPHDSASTTNAEATPSSGVKREETKYLKEGEHNNGGIEFSVNGWETASLFDFNFTGNWFYLGIGVTWGETNEYIKDNIGCRAGGGFHKRYHVSEHVYFDGRAGIYLNYAKLGVKEDKKVETNKSYDGSFAFRPCIGFDLFHIKSSEFSIFAAYEGSVGFKSGSYGNAWSVGICLGM